MAETPASEELFDVVDENDEVISQLARSEVHRQRLRHRAVHIFVFRSDGSLLIHRRADSKEEFPSVWSSSAAGHVAAGESYDETAPRELEEELGFRSSLEFVLRADACEDTCHEFTQLYRTTWDGPINFDRGEITAIRWISLPDLRHELKAAPDEFSPAFRLLFSRFDEGE